ncbi:MAG TPA: MerR family DNA-binding transcriptional regulator [Porticoccaceae bacterium]|jgi:DNA-binding transcriptional MerR regulator|nr:MerR family DNA-binding transcriptional regulator [Gammaproteobacteria bacterium]HIL61558.1 MerR family DNA-binding transcriptional regulator [Porticoccaceae bacterium]
MTKQFSISDLAAEFGITTRTLRFYEEKGLLAPKRIGNTRIFSSAQRVKLVLILRGKRLGFSLEESRDIIEMYDPLGKNKRQLQSLMEKIAEKRQIIEKQRAEINSMLEDLKAVEKNCIQALTESK